jgi:hypothetical protein
MPPKALVAAALLLSMLAPASARQLAIGAAAGYFEPPGFYAKPVYILPNGGAWTPADTSMGYPFREPIYSTPPGYKYIYVRGYYWKRLPDPYAPRLYRRVVRASAAKKTRRYAPCVTDLGFGRYERCGRFYY